MRLLERAILSSVLGVSVCFCVAPLPNGLANDLYLANSPSNTDAYYTEKFAEEYGKIYAYREDYDYEKAWKHVNQAIIYASKVKDWSLRHSLNVLVTTSCLDVGVRFFDSGKYQNALRAFNQGLKLNPRLPVLHYEKALALLELKKEWEATLALYDAYQFNSYPAYRSMIAPIDDEWSYRTNKEPLQSKIISQLKNMGKSVEYPLEVVLKTQNEIIKKAGIKVGEKILFRAIPGIGINLGEFNIYLNDPVSKVYEKLGDPESIREASGENPKIFQYSNKSGIDIEINSNDEVVGIIIYSRGKNIEFEEKMLGIGAHAKQVMDNFGKGFGYEKEFIQGNYTREAIRYNSLGLTFGIDYSDTVGYIYFWTLE